MQYDDAAFGKYGALTESVSSPPPDVHAPAFADAAEGGGGGLSGFTLSLSLHDAPAPTEDKKRRANPSFVMAGVILRSRGASRTFFRSLAKDSRCRDSQPAESRGPA